MSGNGNLLQYPCLKNPMDSEAWWATVHQVANSDMMTEQLSTRRIQIGIGLAKKLIWVFPYHVKSPDELLVNVVLKPAKPPTNLEELGVA